MHGLTPRQIEHLKTIVLCSDEPTAALRVRKYMRKRRILDENIGEILAHTVNIADLATVIDVADPANA